MVCRAFRDLLGSNPQLLSVVDFDQYAEAGKQQCQPHCPPQRAAVLADFEEWQPWGAEPAELQPALDQLPAFLSWLGANAAHVQRLRAAPASDWSHVAQAPQASSVPTCTAAPLLAANRTVKGSLHHHLSPTLQLPSSARPSLCRSPHSAPASSACKACARCAWKYEACCTSASGGQLLGWVGWAGGWQCMMSSPPVTRLVSQPLYQGIEVWHHGRSTPMQASEG